MTSFPFRRTAWSALPALGLFLVAGPSLAAEWHVAPASTQFAGTPGQASSAFLRDHDAALSLKSVQLDRERTMSSGSHHTVRFTQRHGDLPVIGAGAAVRVSSQGVVRAVALEVVRDLSVSPTPISDEAAALAAVQAELGQPVAAVRVEPAVLRDAKVGGRVVWTVDVNDVPGGTRYYVDDVSLLVVARRALAVDVQGRVYTISQAVTPTPADVELLDLTPSSPQKLTGWNGQLTVTNYVSGSSQGGEIELEQEVVPNSGEDFLYDPPVDPLDPADAFAQVNVYYHLTRARDFFGTGFGVDFQQNGWDLTAIANMHENGDPLDNAFFSPMGQGGPFAASNLIAMGQGTEVDFSYDSDVFIHEFAHYVGHNEIGYSQGQAGFDEYGLSPWGGSIDEGVADYFACTLNDDPILGEATMPGGLRDLTDTTKSCPGDILGEVHFDGEIIGSLGWTLRERFGAAIADRLVWDATAMLTPNPSLADFARGVVQAAEDLQAEGTLTTTEVAEVEEFLAARGLDTCEKVLELTEGGSHTSTLFGLDLVAQAFPGGTCAAVKDFGLTLQTLFHYRHMPAEGSEALRFSVDMSAIGGGELDWSIHVRKGEHVTFRSGGFLPEVDEYDQAQNFTGNAGEIVIDATSTPPFDPTAEYFAVVVHQNCPNALATITAGEFTPDNGEGGAGGAPGTGAAGGSGGANAGGDAAESFSAAGGGCSCRATGAESTRAAWPWALVVLSGALYRRRRARAEARACRRRA